MKPFRMWLIAVLSILFSSLCLPFSSHAFQNEPDDFRGIEWGTELSTLDGMAVRGGENEGTKICVRKNDKMSIGAAQLEKLGYMFYDDRFCGVIIRYSGTSNFRSLKETLIHAYGRPIRPNRYLDEYKWQGARVWIFLEYIDITDEGTLFYYYVPIVSEKLEEEKEAARKWADKF